MQFMGRGTPQSTRMTAGNYQRERKHQLYLVKLSRKNRWYSLLDTDRAGLAWLRFRRYGSVKCAELAIKHGH